MKVYLRNNFQEFLLYPSSKCWTCVAFDFHLPQENQRVFPILLLPSSESDYSFPREISLGGTFLKNIGFVHVGYSFVKSGKDLSSEVLLSSVSLFSFSVPLFIRSGFDVFMIKLVLSSKFALSFLSLIYVLYKNCFFERNHVSDQKAINNFLFK